jgi:hypothetical protein
MLPLKRREFITLRGGAWPLAVRATGAAMLVVVASAATWKTSTGLERLVANTDFA